MFNLSLHQIPSYDLGKKYSCHQCYIFASYYLIVDYSNIELNNESGKPLIEGNIIYYIYMCDNHYREFLRDMKTPLI